MDKLGLVLIRHEWNWMKVGAKDTSLISYFHIIISDDKASSATMGTLA